MNRINQTPRRKKRQRNRSVEQLESRILLTSNWQNPEIAEDVSGLDGEVSPMDALVVINELNFPRYSDAKSGRLPENHLADAPFLDVNGDQFVTPQDALSVINVLNAMPTNVLAAQAADQPHNAGGFAFGPEQRVNTVTHRNQANADVAITSTGQHVVVWHSAKQDGSANGIFAQRFDALGQKRGNEFRINQRTRDNQQNASVDVREDGRFVVVWESWKQDGNKWGIYAREFGANGSPASDEFLVNQTTNKDQRLPAVSYLANGGFAVVWEGKGTSDSDGVFARTYSGPNVPSSEEVRVNATTNSTQSRPSVDAFGSGFVVAWDGKGTGDSEGVFARTLNVSGNPTSNEFRLNRTTTKNQERVDVVAIDDNSFAAAWQSKSQDGSSWGVYANVFDSNGNSSGLEWLVNKTTNANQSEPSVAVVGDGTLMIGWHGKGDGDSNGAFIRAFDATGVAKSGELLLNATTNGNQQHVSVAASNDQVVGVWDGKGPGDSSGVFSRLLGLEAQELVDDFIEVPGLTGDSIPTTFTWLTREAGYENELGIYLVDDMDGRIGSLLPSDSGYAQAAIASTTSTIVFHSGQTAGAESEFNLPGNSLYGMYLIQNSTTQAFLNNNPENDLNDLPLAFFGFNAASPDSFDHVRSPSENVFAWEDLTGGGDRDFDDMIFEIEFGEPTGGSNAAPILEQIVNQTIAEGSLLSFSAMASDPDGNNLTFSLVPGAPLTATIDPVTGIFNWTTDEADGPGVFDVTVQVTDGGSPPLSDSQSFQITVQEVNSAPTLNPIGNQSVNELDELSFTAVASDPDLPANGLTYSLGPGAPSGAMIDPATGAFSWTPTEEQGPDSFDITIQVSDDGSPALSDSETIQVQVDEVNSAPIIDPIAPKSVEPGSELSFTVTATDADIPANTLTFSLDPGAPVGAFIDPVSGDFSWTPEEGSLPGTISITVRVQDDGPTPISSARAFDIEVLGEAADIALAEVGQFVVEHSVPVELGQSEGTRLISFDVVGLFDTSDQSTASEDTFLVYLVDPQDSSTTLLDRGENGTALFSLAGNDAELVPGLVRFNGDTVEIDVTSLDQLTEGNLLFQILNQDNDDGTQIGINNLTNVVLEDERNALTFPVSRSVASAGPVVDLSTYSEALGVELLIENTRFDSTTGEYLAEISLQNGGSSTGSHLAVVFPDLPASVQIQNASGTNAQGEAYVNFQESVAPGGLGSREQSEPIELVISNPAATRFSLQPQVLTAGPNQAPILDQISPVSMMPGEYLAIQLTASDPDGDPLRFSIASDAPLPTTELTVNGRIIFTPELGQEGSYIVVATVSDGAEFTTREFAVDILADPLSTTRVTGQVRNLEDEPMVGLRVSIDALDTLTDSSGVFTFELSDTAQPDELTIHGDEFPGDISYAFLQKRFTTYLGRELMAGALNTIARPIFLPPLDTINVTEISQDSDTIVTNFNLPGVKLMIPQGAAHDTEGNPLIGSIGVMEVPEGLTPAELPPHLLPDAIYAVYTIDTTGVEFSIPAGLTVPNKAGYAPGTPMDLWEVDHDTGKFAVFGKGVVSDDGALIEPLPGQGGVVSGLGGRNGTNWRVFVPEPGDGDNDTKSKYCSCEYTKEITSAVGLYTGFLTETHSLANYQSQGVSRGVSLVYDSSRAFPTKALRFSYDIGGVLVHISEQPPANQVMFAEVNVFDGSTTQPVVDLRANNSLSGTSIHTWSATNLPIGGTVGGSVVVDATRFATGIYDYELRTGFGVRSGGKVNGSSSLFEDSIVVVNSIGSPFGDGWGVAGVQEIVEETNLKKRLAGSVILVDGDGSELLFVNSPVPGQENVFLSPPGDFSKLEKRSDGTYQRTMPDQTVYSFNTDYKLSTITDRNGNITRYEYNSFGQIKMIVDPVGLETVFEYENGTVRRILNPDGRPTTLNVDANGDLIQVMDPDGAERSWSYDDRNLLRSEQTKNGFGENIRFNSAAQVTGATRGDGSVVEVLSVENQTVAGRVGNDGTSPFPQTSPSEVARFTDGNGSTEEYSLGTDGRLRQITDVLGTRFRVTLNDDLQVAERVDGNGNREVFAYDGKGNQTIAGDSISGFAFQPNGSSYPGRSYEADSRANFFVLEDINRDLIPDLVTANLNGDTVSVFLGLANGTFSDRSDYLAGDSPDHVAIGDVNSDSVPDIAIANFNTGKIQLLTGDGDGTFSFSSAISVGGRARSVILEDVNSDGVLDIAAATFLPFGVAVAFGNGDGTFSSVVQYAVGDRPESLLAADFNGDSVLDLVTANGLSDSVSVLLGQGNGSFGQRIDHMVGNFPACIVTEDIDGDGNVDVITANQTISSSESTGDIGISLGIGDGTFADSVNIDLGDVPTSLALADFDEDDHLDIVVTLSGTDSVAVLFGQSSTVFTDPVLIPVGYSPQHVAAMDVNGDGHSDLAIAASSSRVQVLLGSGNGEFTVRVNYDTEGATGVALHDFNGDGFLDAAVANLDVDTLSIFSGDSTGTLTLVSTISAGNGPNSIVVEDINDDGFSDIVVGHRIEDTISVFLGQSGGSFLPRADFPAGRLPNSPVVVDLNGDSALDVVVANFPADEINVLLGQGNGQFLPPISHTVGDAPHAVAAGDLNGDGRADVVAANNASDSVTVLLGTADGGLGKPMDFAVGRFPLRVALGDLNADGNLDIVSGNTLQDNVSVLLGRGDGTFDEHVDYDAGNVSGLAIVDIDGDGILDIVTSDRLGDAVIILSGVGNGTFADRSDYGVGTFPLDIAIGDLNSDGGLDIITANNRNTTQRVTSSMSVLFRTLNTGQGAQGPSSRGYDETFSQPTSRSDELGRTTTFEIDPANGNTLEILRPGNLRTAFSYVGSGQIESMTDALGRVSKFEYDASGRTKTLFAALGTGEQGIQHFEYDDAGNQTAFVDENGNRTEFEYDEMNRLRFVHEPDPDGVGPQLPATTEFRYDDAGNLRFAIDGRGNLTENRYDGRDRLRFTINDEGMTEFRYDKEGNLRFVIDPLFNVTENRYDVRNRLVLTIDPDGGRTEFRYDGNNNLISLTDPVANRTLFFYDARDRLVREDDPLGNATDYVYDAADNLIRKIDRNERVTEFAYDDLDRLQTEIWVGGGNVIGYAYDDVDNLLSVSDALSSLAFTYDARDRVRTVDNAGTPGAPNVVLTYGYDRVGNVTSVADVIDGVAGATTLYGYDGLNRTISIEQSGTSVSEKAVDFLYNELGQFDEIARYSDIGRSNLVARTDYAYDDLNRLTDLDHTNALDDVLSFYDFDYDSASRITRIADIDGVTNYSYDDRSQLTGADRTDGDVRGDESYDYDANGNRESSHLQGSGYVTGEGNRLFSDGTYNYQYDDEGNMIRRTEIVSGDFRVFEWDYRNRLVRIIDLSTGAIITQEVGFAYDGLDRRVLKSVDLDGEGSDVETALHFINDRKDVLLDYLDVDGSGGGALPTLDQRYLHGPEIDQVLAQEAGEGFLRWMLANQLGSVAHLVDSSGVVLESYQYDSFGIISSADDAGTRYLFTGREFDKEIGLYFYRARTYSASLGRFLSPDSISVRASSSNEFAYVQNSPILNIDPDGRDSISRGAISAAQVWKECYFLCKSKSAAPPIPPGVPPAVTICINIAKYLPIADCTNDCYKARMQFGERRDLRPKTPVPVVPNNDSDFQPLPDFDDRAR